MRKFVVLFLFVILITNIAFAGYQVSYPAKTNGESILHFAIQSIFKSTYDFVNTQQEHFIGFIHYGFLDNLDIGITANYHIIDIKTPFSNERKHGVGDPALYARWLLFNNEWINIGLKCDLNIPIGNENFKSETFTHNSILISEFKVKYVIPYFTFGHYTISKTDGYFRFNFGVQTILVPIWFIFVDMYTEIHQIENIHIPYYIVIGNIIKFDNNMFRIEYIINTRDFKSERGFFALRYMHNFNFSKPKVGELDGGGHKEKIREI